MHKAETTNVPIMVKGEFAQASMMYFPKNATGRVKSKSRFEPEIGHKPGHYT